MTIDEIIEEMRSLGATVGPDSYTEWDIWGCGDPQCCGSTVFYYRVYFVDKNGVQQQTEDFNSLDEAFEDALEMVRNGST